MFTSEFCKDFKATIMFPLFNSHSRRKYYRKEFLLMKIYNIAKWILLKRVVVNPALKKKLNAPYITVMMEREKGLNFVKSQINHNKTEKKTTSNETTGKKVRLKT